MDLNIDMSNTLCLIVIHTASAQCNARSYLTCSLPLSSPFIFLLTSCTPLIPPPSSFHITLQTFLIHLTYFHLLIKITFYSQLISEVFKSGFSRIPVYGRDQSDILGLLHTKDLIFLDPAVSHVIS